MTTFVPPIEESAPGLETRVPEGAFASAQTRFLAAGAIGLIASAIGWITDSQQFYFSYLTAYVWVLSFCLGAMIFVLIQHLTRAGWSVVVRRLAENIMGVTPLMLPLFLPIAIGYGTLYHHWVHPVDGDTVLSGKSGFLNVPFFFARAAIYFAVWISISTWFRRKSLEQDRTGDPQITLKMARVAAPCTLLFALSVTFAAFDWLMSLDPHWFSTIFGVWYFAGGFMGTMGLMALTIMWLQKSGHLRNAVNTEHLHDLGKLMFAFVVFWAYVSFSQFMLIYYANLPEETAWFSHRYEGVWYDIGVALCLGHFLIPFGFLMSRHMKRGRTTLGIGAVLMLTMHFIDHHWVVMPILHTESVHLSWLDFTTLIGLFGVFFAFFLSNLRRTPLVPERDPRLRESLGFVNH